MPRGPKLSKDGANRKEFIEGLFADKSWRQGIKGKIGKAVAENPPTAWLIADEERQTILSALKKGWTGGHGSCADSDKEWLLFLKGYVNANKLAMWVPKVEVAKAGPPVSYNLHGYQEFDFAKGSTVDLFLQLFLAGAHFVVIHSSEDLGKAGKDFYHALTGELSTSSPLGHSHYAGTKAGNPGSGAVYPRSPEEYPYVVALLSDHTSRSDPNTFFQMEGWPLFAVPYASLDAVSLAERDADRHLKTDFATHNDTLWNISTYGACAFSEKRGTTIFLAPKGSWAPYGQERDAEADSDSDPIMTPYRGSTTRQWWLKATLINRKLQSG